MAVDDCSFVNDGQTVLVCRNSGGAPDTATVVTPATVKGLALADAAITVAAGAIGYIGPFDPVYFNQPDGTVHVDVTTALMRFAAISTAT